MSEMAVFNTLQQPKKTIPGFKTEYFNIPINRIMFGQLDLYFIRLLGPVIIPRASNMAILSKPLWSP